MNITRTSFYSGITRTKDLNITEEQIATHKSGTFIQTAMPNLTAEDREFYMSGITAEEWNEICPPPEDDKPAELVDTTVPEPPPTYPENFVLWYTGSKKEQLDRALLRYNKEQTGQL